MRILQLITRRQRRGAEVFATELSDVLARRGHEVTIAGLYEADPVPTRPEAASFVDLDARRSRLSREAARRVAGLIEELRPDIVQANGSDTFKYSALARWRSPRRWPLVYRNISMASQWLRHPAHRAWNRWLVRQIDHVVSVSEASADDFRRTYRLPPERVTSIPRAVRVPERVDVDAARRALGALVDLGPDALLLVHVGSFTPEKNHLFLLDAFARVAAVVPAARLVCIGDGPLRGEVERGVAARGLGARVHLLGKRPDASDLVAAAELMVLPSRVEGIPGVVLEAAAQGVPAVATDVGGVGEAIRAGVTGLLVAPGDRDAFVDGVVSLLADPGLRLRMGQAARDLVRARFELGAVADAYETLYERLHAPQSSAL